VELNTWKASSISLYRLSTHWSDKGEEISNGRLIVGRSLLRRTPEQEKPRASSASQAHVRDPSLTVTQGQIPERFEAGKAEMSIRRGVKGPGHANLSSFAAEMPAPTRAIVGQSEERDFDLFVISAGGFYCIHKTDENSERGWSWGDLFDWRACDTMSVCATSLGSMQSSSTSISSSFG
jgi:hypothetical protein